MFPKTRRVLINRDAVGDFDFNSDRDFFLQGNADDVVLGLLRELDWLDEFKMNYPNYLP